MKWTETIKKQITGLGSSVIRFPVTALLSFTLMSLLITLNEMNIDGSGNQELIERLAMATAIGMLFSISMKHIYEAKLDKYNSILMVSVPTAVIMFLYYLFFTKDMDLIRGIQFAGAIVALIIGIFYSLKVLQPKQAYEAYVIRIFSGLFLTVLYAGVLFFGISAIIFTINSLFDADIEGKWFFYVFLMDTFIFGALMFLSKLPRKEDTFEEAPYSKGLKVLLLYIVIPLITIYTGILYVYFVRILVSSEWPRGLVSNLVLWYSVVAAAVIFFLTPILEENKLAKIFRTWFPRVLLPILAMMFVSIGKRIHQYGVTENRYFVVLLGLWVLGIMVYFILVKNGKNIIIPVTLSLIAIVSVFGPLSAFNVSAFSQNQRFTALLEKNNMLVSGEITPGTNVSKTDQENISSIVQYFENRNLDQLKYVPESYTYNDFKTVFGFEKTYDYYTPDTSYFYVNTEIESSGFTVGGYDYLFFVNSYMEPKSIDQLTVSLKDMTTLVLEKNGTTLLEENLSERLASIAEENNMANNGKTISKEEISFVLENNEVEVKVVLREMSGRKETDDSYIFDQLSLVLLLNLK
ncbi:DUF4153 domain-containing protein [Proteiniclasticum sp.]|uniref:DUF4153 domain-containing protein n=1 Tax=Proteiniclasticum sp. TaxID=2053595 RepID=UPI0028A23359|nr:DUF4153 domain-containing protein [Proteiniclasticum sp.]